MPRLSKGKGTKPRNVKAIAAVAGGLLAFAVLGYLLVISPQKSRAAKLTTDIEAANAQLVAAQAASHVKPPVDPRVDELFKLTKAMPATTDMPGLLVELSRVADETGIKFDSITPDGAPAPAGSYQTQPMTLVFRGNYYELSDFLFRLNNLVQKRDGKLDVDGRLYSVNSVDFSKTSGNTLSAQISTTAFIYGAGAPSATAATPTPATTTPAPAPATPPATAPTGATG